MMFDEEAKLLAKQNGAKTAYRSPLTWKGKPIFIPLWKTPDGEENISGLPQYIILDGEQLRWTVGEECLEVHSIVACSQDREAFLIRKIAEIEAKLAELD